MSAAIVAWGAVSPLGEGESAFAADRGITRVVRDGELASAGLRRPFCARASIDGDRDRATLLLERALAACSAELAHVLPDLGRRRVGLAVGTSSGGMRTFETAATSIEGTYLGPLLASARSRAYSPFSLVLGACASSTLAIGIGRTWLEASACDVVLAGGFDAVSVFVAAGFESLRATSATCGPQPFRKGRDGLALGEGAAFVALVRGEDAPPAAVRAYVTGFGATCDALHLTAPDREGKGLARAARAALEEAGRPELGLVSAHGTATEFNDASEARALAALELGAVPVHAFKGTIGHTLGAAGVLETLAAVDALTRGVVPTTAGEGQIDGGVSLPPPNTLLSAKNVLKLASAFGGANAALVLAAAPGPPPATQRQAWISRAVLAKPRTAAALAARTGYAEDKIARADELVRLAIAAIADLEDAVGPLRGGDTGILIGHGLATIETNAIFQARIREAGPTRAEPRRFPFTTPNAAAGECAVAFGLGGPAFAVGGGPHGGIEALAVARDLVAAGIAERIVVVAVDEGGEASRAVAPETSSGAVACVVSAAPLAARIEQCVVELAAGPATVPRAMDAHRALLPLVSGCPERLEAPVPGGGFANATLLWL